MQHLGPIVAINNDLKVIACQNCGYAHLENLPLQEQIDELYLSDKFYQENGDNWFKKEANEYNKGWWHSLYRYQTKLLDSRYIVDVGSGAGWYIAECSSYGTVAWGVEPSLKARKFGQRGLSTFAGLEDAKHLPEYVGTDRLSVRMSLVLEHVLDPLSFLSEVYAFVGKRLLVVVPNEFNPLQNRVKGFWFVSKHHLNYFTPETLRNLLDKAGFQTVFETATFPMELFLLAGLNYRDDPKLGEKCHCLRLRFEELLGNNAFELYCTLYKRYGWGRELIFVAERS